MDSVRSQHSPTRASRTICGVALLAAALSVRPSESGAALLGVVYDAVNTPVYRIDEQSGTIHPVGLSGFGGLTSLALSPEGVYYSVAPYPLSPDSMSLLVAVDPGSGAAAPVVPLSLAGVRALACDAAGTLYGTLMNGDVMRINPSTGGSDRVVRTGFYDLQGLAASADGMLYAWDSGAGLIVIDPVAATAADVSLSMGGSPSIMSLYFDAGGGLMGARRSLFSVDRHTGETQEILDFGGLDVRGVEVLVPEPGSLLLAGAAAAGLSLSRRRRQSAASFAGRHDINR